ncbi:neuroglian-like [Haemaphysalis longicornis]
MGIPMVLLLLQVTASVSVTPPTIVKQPPDQVFFHVPSSLDDVRRPVRLECEAEGDPEPEYKWIKDNEEFDYASQDGRISRQPGRGTLVFTAPVDGDEGVYQCHASNELGTSLSNVVQLRKAHLANFPEEDRKDVYVKEGEPLSLHCDPPSGYPHPNVTWLVQTHDGAARRINSSRITADPVGGLHFSRAELGDAIDDGVYACSFISPFLNEYKIGNQIWLHVAPMLNAETLHVAPVMQYLSPENIVALQGAQLVLYCIYGGEPLPLPTWSRGRVHKMSPRFSIGNNDKTLVIKPVELEDDDTYECRVDNGVGDAQRHIMRVKVEAAPSWRNAPNNTDAAAGETVMFKCSANGIPPPNVEWFVNGVPIEKADPNTRWRVLGDMLIFEEVEKSDIAVYQCNASNRHGFVFRNFYLNVRADPPTIAEGPENVTVALIASRVKLRCRVHGMPRADVEWYKEGQPLRGTRYQVLDSGDLEISDVLFTDDGVYTCRASNKYGKASAYGSLQVQRRTWIASRPENYKVAVNETALFRCGAETDPRREVNIEWLFNGKRLELDADPRLLVQADGSLVITRASLLDTGIYTCLARTRLDNDSAEATLVVQDVPTPPQLVRVTCDGLVALVEWKHPEKLWALTHNYMVQSNASFAPENWEYAVVNISATNTKSNVSMRPWANYTFRVLARNKIGISLPSEASSMCTTPEDVPYKNPDDVMASGNRFEHLVISWTPMPPVDHHAPGFFYRVLWKREDLPDAVWNSQNIEDWKQGRYVVGDQLTFNRYRVKVEAHNHRGQAHTAAAEVIGYSGEDVPLAAPKDFRLLQVVDSRSAEFIWSAVDSNSARGHLRGYKIETWTREEGEKKLRYVVVAANATTALVDLFQPSSRNLVRLRVLNEQHNGPATDTIEFMTPEGTPGPVASFEAVPLGASAFYLSWQKPSEANGVLTGYRIYYQELRGTQLGPVIERRPAVLDPLAVHAKLACLKPRTTYRITIRATTAEGLGDPYFTEARTGDQTERLPDMPDFTWVQVPDGNDTSAIQVTWLPAIKGHPGSEFYVQYRLKGDKTWHTTTVEEYEDRKLVYGLEKDALYEIRVVAIDGEHAQPSLIKMVDIGVTETQTATPGPSLSTSNPTGQGDPLELDVSERPPMIDADICPCQENYMHQNQSDTATLLAAIDRQAKALGELKGALQKGFAELQESLVRLLRS